MDLAFQTEEFCADSLKAHIDTALPRDEFISSCLQHTRRLHQLTNDRSVLLFYAMLTLGRFTKGTAALQQFSQLFDELGEVECANIVTTGEYRKEDLAFYWSISTDLSHLFEPSKASAVERFSSCAETRQLSDTIMQDEWSDYAFHEVDKIPTRIEPRHWRLYKLQNATIAYDTAEFVVLDHAGNPVIDLCSSHYQHIYFTHMFKDYLFNKQINNDVKSPAVNLENALMIQDLIRQPNFCHWLLDQLPRLRHLEDSQRIIMYKLAPFMKNMLDIMGIDPNRVYELQERAVVCVKNLSIESSMARDFSHPIQHGNKELIDFVKQSLSAQLDESKNEKKKSRIYLSRNKYEGRRISNEADLLSILEKYDFHTVYPEELSVGEQISLFTDADVIVSPHGASLANIIFCKNVTLVEIFNQNYGTPTFYLIAKLLGFQYQHVLGTNPLLSNKEKMDVGLPNLQYEDMEVDLGRLDQCLKKIVGDFSKKKEAKGLQFFLQKLIRCRKLKTS